MWYPDFKFLEDCILVFSPIIPVYSLVCSHYLVFLFYWFVCLIHHSSNCLIVCLKYSFVWLQFWLMRPNFSVVVQFFAWLARLFVCLVELLIFVWMIYSLELWKNKLLICLTGFLDVLFLIFLFIWPNDSFVNF